MDSLHCGKSLRLTRLLQGDGGIFVVPLDHSVTNGPIATAEGTDSLIGTVGSSGADAVVLHKGRLRYIPHERFRNLALIVHLSASTAHAQDTDAKYLVADVEEAIKLGADAVSVHVNLGSKAEAQQIADLAIVAKRCAEWNMPLMAMMYPRGPRIEDPHEPGLVSHAATLAADLGADVVKTVYAGSVEAMSEVVRACPAPIVVAGGSRHESPSALLSYVEDVMLSGVEGVAIGRNVFEAEDPGAIARRVSRVVHQPREGAYAEKETMAEAVVK